MKISDIESGRASAAAGEASVEAKILPADRPRGSVSARTRKAGYVSPLEHGMEVAERALADIPDVREDQVQELKKRIANGEYEVKGEDVAEMMLRRLAADRVR